MKKTLAIIRSKCRRALFYKLSLYMNIPQRAAVIAYQQGSASTGHHRSDLSVNILFSGCQPANFTAISSRQGFVTGVTVSPDLATNYFR